MPSSVYFTAPILPAARAYLQNEGYGVTIGRKYNPVRPTISLIRSSGLACLLSHPISKQVLDKAPNLRVISVFAVGYNNVDWAQAHRSGIWVTHTPGVLTEATADLTWALILGVSRIILPADRFIREGRFEGWKSDLFLGRGLQGKTLGIFGMGRIGMSVAQRARVFGMKVIYHNRKPVRRNVLKKAGLNEAQRVTFQALLKRSDVLSLHCPLTNETRRKFTRTTILAMKKGSIFINTARGEIVDEKALAQCLRTRHLAGAGLDVYEREPAVEPGLMKLENVLLLPHIGSATLEVRTQMALMVAEDIHRVISGKRPKHPIPETPKHFRPKPG